MTYEVRVCPFCGAQVGDHDSEFGWEFTCEHDNIMSDYGVVTPLTLPATVEGVAEAVAAAAAGLEARREQLLREKAERRKREEARRAALPPEARDREDRLAEANRKMFRSVYADLAKDLNRQVYGP